MTLNSMSCAGEVPSRGLMVRAWAACGAALPVTGFVLAGAWGGHAGAWWSLPVVVLVATVWLLRRPASAVAQNSSKSVRTDDHYETQRMLQQVVQVWKRNVDAAQAHSERSMHALLESFSSISTHLEQALGSQGDNPLLEVGAIDALLLDNKPQLDRLLETTRAAVKLKNEMAQGVAEMAQTLSELVTLSKEVQTISRATHLLAMNASVEATRLGRGSGGTSVVAQEVQRLAAQSRDAGLQIARRVTSMQQRMDGLKWLSRKEDMEDDEVELRAEENARAVMAQLIGAVAKVTRSSRGIRSANRDVQGDLEKIFVGMQSQDRLSQMMTAVTDDMGRLTAWLAGAPDSAGGSAHAWLERLEASYTMEELRSSHHNTVTVDKAAGVEFF